MLSPGSLCSLGGAGRGGPEQQQRLVRGSCGPGGGAEVGGGQVWDTRGRRGHRTRCGVGVGWSGLSTEEGVDVGSQAAEEQV